MQTTKAGTIALAIAILLATVKIIAPTILTVILIILVTRRR